MLIRADIKTKTIGAKSLLRDLHLEIQDGEKVGLIGRNGVGKSTLLGMLYGNDRDFEGEIIKRRGLRLVITAQEHFDGDATVLNYICQGLPEFTELSAIIAAAETMGEDMAKIQRYTEAVTRFHELGYDNIESAVLKELEQYQIGRDQAHGPLRQLSGGQKRFVEIVKVTQAAADLALIDEPTNHMDYVAKATFEEWVKQTKMGLLIVTHDRDVLRLVDRIIELKDGGAISYKGGYDDYLRQNSTQTVAEVGQYEVAQRTIDNLKKQIAYARSKKAGWSGTADKKNPFVVMEERLMKQLKQLEAEVGRPSFWIDQESVEQLPTKMVDRYNKYKARNIKLTTKSGDVRSQELLRISDLSLGYDQPLFTGLNFTLGPGQRLRLHGRNGAGKTTLLKAIRRQVGEPIGRNIQTFGGQIEPNQRLKLGIYEQEIGPEYLNMGLGAAVLEVFRRHNLPIDQQAARRVLADYLFDPVEDYPLAMGRLSGGQRARFQLIAMLAPKPDLLVLDEPTNHLDLPSIEELEQALAKFAGAILYVSHDSYFDQAIGGEVIRLERLEAAGAAV